MAARRVRAAHTGLIDPQTLMGFERRLMERDGQLSSQVSAWPVTRMKIAQQRASAVGGRCETGSAAIKGGVACVGGG